MKDNWAGSGSRVVTTVGSFAFLFAIALAVGARAAAGVQAAGAQSVAFGPGNPFYAASTLPFHAPAFNRIKDSDYQPAIDAGMSEELKEVDAIANNPAPATFENTFVALERSGRLLDRVMEVFNCVTGANTDDALEKVQAYEAPRLAAESDAIHLNAKLFARIKAVYAERAALHLDAEALRLVEWDYQEFVHAGANLSPADKDKLKKINEEDSTLENAFQTKLLAAAKAGAYVAEDEGAMAGLSQGQLAAAAREGAGSQAEGLADSAAEYDAATGAGQPEQPLDAAGAV